MSNKKFNNLAEKEIYAELLKELKGINSPNQLMGFLNKFMTASEITLLFRRIAAIKLLEKKKTYRDIKKILGISSGTISRVADIIAGRGYSRNPNRKRKYSATTAKSPKFKPYRRKYKGAESLINPIDFLT